MERIPLYTNLENILEIFDLERESLLFQGSKLLLTRESEVIFCEDEETIYEDEFFSHVAKELSSSDFTYRFRNESEEYLIPPFKANLQECFSNKSSVFLSTDAERISNFTKNNGILMGCHHGLLGIYKNLNFNRDDFRANKVLTIGNDFKSYDDFKPFILPFCEIIINDPYLFIPEQRGYALENYLKYNFEALVKSIFSKVQNKVHIIICTLSNETTELESPWYDRTSRKYDSLYNYINKFFKDLLGGPRYNLWFVVSPKAYDARHDRFIVTNYQYIESGAGLTYFDHNGTFINRGEAIHLYSIMHDEARKSLIPHVIEMLQSRVIDPVRANRPNRIFGLDKGDSYLLKFT